MIEVGSAGATQGVGAAFEYDDLNRVEGAKYGVPSADLVAAEFPGVEVRGDLGEHQTLLSIDKARRLLGYDPRHSWRDHV